MARQGLSNSDDRLSVAAGAAITGEYLRNKPGIGSLSDRYKCYQNSAAICRNAMPANGLQIMMPPDVVLSPIRLNEGKSIYGN